MLELYKKGDISYAQIGMIFGITRQAVHKIVKRLEKKEK